MQILVACLLFTIFVAAEIAAGPLPSDDLDYWYPTEVLVQPYPYDVQDYAEDGFYSSDPELEEDPDEYDEIINDLLDLVDKDEEDEEKDEDDEGEDEDDEGKDEEAEPDLSDGPPNVKNPKTPSSEKSRQRRQSGDLVLDTPNRDGSRRQLYKPRFYLNGGGGYTNKKNYGLGYSGGMGALLYRSRNGRHSVGASVGASGSHENSYGYKRNTPPWRNMNYGLGYTYSFG
ncbi:hypothetical protein FHG87_016019 [Trinorchestia longiramus]|nr:hypothetical protein FHG87_016019 [Trinorchestia longiramus]